MKPVPPGLAVTLEAPGWRLQAGPPAGLGPGQSWGGTGDGLLGHEFVVAPIPRVQPSCQHATEGQPGWGVSITSLWGL